MALLFHLCLKIKHPKFDEMFVDRYQTLALQVLEAPLIM